MRALSPTGLYWSKTGVVLCAEHAKGIDDAQWAAERWMPIVAKRPDLYQCQTCNGSAVRHAARRDEPRK